jgi:hypothetical protein
MINPRRSKPKLNTQGVLDPLAVFLDAKSLASLSATGKDFHRIVKGITPTMINCNLNGIQQVELLRSLKEVLKTSDEIIRGPQMEGFQAFIGRRLSDLQDGEIIHLFNNGMLNRKLLITCQKNPQCAQFVIEDSILRNQLPRNELLPTPLARRFGNAVGLASSFWNREHRRVIQERPMVPLVVLLGGGHNPIINRIRNSVFILLIVMDLVATSAKAKICAAKSAAIGLTLGATVPTTVADVVESNNRYRR